MQKRKHIVFVTGSRADYGIMRRYLKLLNNDSEVDLGILVTGALLDNTYGYQVNLIYDDKFKIEAEIELYLDSSSTIHTLKTMAEALEKFSVFFHNKHIDLLIILGDRYEMLSVAISAAMQRIPLLHIHGGEATFANYDEFIRHSITKMSLYHFTSTKEYQNRVIQLGENPERVYNLGALGAENCLYIDELNVPNFVKELPQKKYFVILFHPETLTNINVIEQIGEVLEALEKHGKYIYIFIGSNADTYSDLIRKKIHIFVDKHQNAIYYENLHTDAYHYLLKNAIALIGNSSSGIIEAPSLGIYTINIGRRQDGRIKGNSIISIECKVKEIEAAMIKVVEQYKSVKPVNPYYQENAAERYFYTTKSILNSLEKDSKYPKIFYDIKKVNKIDSK